MYDAPNIKKCCYNIRSISSSSISSGSDNNNNNVTNDQSSSKTLKMDIINDISQINNKVHDPSTERKMSALELQHLVRKGKKIAMITAYDYPTVSYVILF